MPRRLEAYLEDILQSIERIESYTEGMDFEDFSSDQKTEDAVVNNLENIGEAVKAMPEDAKEDKDVDWESISGFRDVLVHQYFRADTEIIWDIVENELPELREAVEDML